MKYLNACIRLVIVYRPPPSEQNGLKKNYFFDEFNSLLECLAITSSKLLITGDFNFHVNKPSETYAKKFLRMLNGFNLEQHVSEATHNGNTLDLLITRSIDNFISDVRTMPGLINPKLFDHYAIRSQVKLKKPSFEQKEIIYRKLRAVDIEVLQTDIKSSTLLSDYSDMDLTPLVENFEITLTNVLDTHAPIKKRTITFGSYAPWYNDSIDVEKRKRRKLERRWRKSNLSTDRQLYITQCGIVNDMISDAKSIYYSSIIAENKGNQKVLFKTIDQLLQRKQEPCFPTSTSSEQLVNEFAAFFHEKISKMRCSLSHDSESIINPLPDLLCCQSKLTDFCTVNTNDIRKYLVSSGFKTCDVDPLPSILLRECLDILLPVITRIVNLSLTTGNVPRHFKDAMVRPKLKKDSLDHQLFSHFRPISNLKLLSKVTEKAVACQLTDYLNANGLQERLQSAYKVAHSTETALLKVKSDIFNAINKQESVLLLLLDLSAAFDTVDHVILLSRLNTRYGIKGNALHWFASYLKDRRQFIQVESTRSSFVELQWGVPQGSVLGPILYTLYTAPLGGIIRKHDLQFHLYADDCQIYVSFKSGCIEESAALLKMEACAKEIYAWMACKKLKLNRDKTEFLVIHAKHRPRPPICDIKIAGIRVVSTESARNIGVMFNDVMNHEHQVQNICKVAFFHIRNLSKIRKCLTQKDTETLVHAFVTSKLDNCNSLLAELPQYLLDKVQRVQNAAARLVSCTRKYDRITLVLKELHWLPVKQRIILKILLFTYKALNALAPQYISDLLVQYKPPRALRSSDGKLLQVPHFKLKTYGGRSFSYIAPYLWNQLPDAIRQAPSLAAFKSNLKTYLFDQVFN